jgi:hypothetical protein
MYGCSVGGDEAQNEHGAQGSGLRAEDAGADQRRGFWRAGRRTEPQPSVS